ncbi:hypothetical protein GWI33_013122 [Rhynchophorus ferrugineus]|uniref:BRISC and BRCA1-A complex member 2 n=1 Tax=Rhynchophorus ferrugineus TaxID=354439 RepID=A0A834I415_RHYFE|nr:hypothetical protein GWI33_013122 [Rhynchophorus ferrugineus]
MSDVDYYKHIQENIKELLYGNIGFHRLEKNLIETKQNNFIEQNQNLIVVSCHFCIKIPYAGVFHDYEIIFNPDNFNELPDFHFNFMEFLDLDINYITENIPTWENWDLTNSKSLLNILNEFHILYKKYLLKVINQNPYSHIKKEYNELMELLHITEDKIEVLPSDKNCMDQTNSEYSNDDISAFFCICLPIDSNALPEYYQENCDDMLNPGDDFAKLCIGKKGSDGRAVHLSLSPRIQQFLGFVELPKFARDNTVSKYVLRVKHILDEKIRITSEQYKNKHLFVSALVETFSNGIVEYDTRKFSNIKVHFLYENLDDYNCLVSVTLDGKPKERPRIELQSLYCQVGPSCNISTFFAYQPGALIEDNLAKIKNFLQIETFRLKNHKH